MEEQVVNKKKTIATIFHSFFTNVGIKLANDIVVPLEHNLKHYLNNKSVYLLMLNLFLN